MSKKIMALVLTLSMLLCFTACGSETDSVETATSQSNSNETSEIVPASEPEPDPKTTPEYHFTEAVQERGVLTVGVSGNSKTCYRRNTEIWRAPVPETCRRYAAELPKS